MLNEASNFFLTLKSDISPTTTVSGRLNFFKSIVAEVNSFGIQIVSGDIKSGSPKFDQQSSRAAGGFKDAFHSAACVFLETCLQKSKFRCNIRSKEQIVVFGIIIDAGGDFGRHDVNSAYSNGFKAMARQAQSQRDMYSTCHAAAYRSFRLKAALWSYGTLKNARGCRFSQVLACRQKPLRISITVIHLVLNVEFEVDMLPRLRKTGLKM